MNIPAHVVESVSCLLKPYGVDFAAVVSMANSNASAKRYLTPREASAYCGLSSKTLREKVAKGEIAAIKIGNHEKSRVLIEFSALNKWLDSFSRNN